MAKVGYVNYTNNLATASYGNPKVGLTGANQLVKNMNMMGLSPKAQNFDDQEAQRGRNIDLNELKNLLA